MPHFGYCQPLCSNQLPFSQEHRHKYKTDKRAMGGFFFQYPDALHELNRVMAARCAEIALALDHLEITESQKQAGYTTAV